MVVFSFYLPINHNNPVLFSQEYEVVILYNHYVFFEKSPFKLSNAALVILPSL